VIDETLTVLRLQCGTAVAVAFRKALENSKVLELLWVTEAIENAARKIFEKRSDKTCSLTAYTSFALMVAITFDEHFARNATIQFRRSTMPALGTQRF